MYVPAHFAPPSPAAVRELLDRHGAADLVTATDEGLRATLLPFVHDPAPDGGPGVLRGHLARTNDHWQLAARGEAMVIVRGPDTYVSPTWYASKAEHGRVVPTWNYVTAHVYGRLEVHDDVDWTARVVRDLTARHEAGRTPAWDVDDAPAAFTAGQLRAIVGVEVVVTRVEAKWKLSQNRPPADVQGVIDALSNGDAAARAVARAMDDVRAPD